MKKPKEELSVHLQYTAKTACPAMSTFEAIRVFSVSVFAIVYSQPIRTFEKFKIKMSRIKKRQLQVTPGKKMSYTRFLVPETLFAGQVQFLATFRLFCCFAEQKADLPRLCCESHDFTTDLSHALVSWQLISHVFSKSNTPKKNLKCSVRFQVRLQLIYIIDSLTSHSA